MSQSSTVRSFNELLHSGLVWVCCVLVWLFYKLVIFETKENEIS